MALLNSALSIALLVALIWGIRTLAELRRCQRELIDQVAQLTEGLGVATPPKKPVIVCDNCGADYDAELTGCNICGRAKSQRAVPIVRSSASARHPQA